jgi:dolichyl-diphosphooligosaccharide--protein glycosyltransferase
MLSQYVPYIGGLSKISDILYGAGIYGKKVSMTIGEAGTYDISQMVMSFGPALFWIAWIGFFLLGYRYLTKDHRRDHFFLLLIFIIQIWFIGIAGRFINDLIPPIILISSWFLWVIVDKIDYTAMIKGIKRVGGLQGLRKGVSFLHVFGILFIAFLLILPNAYLSLDAAVPYEEKPEVFDDLPSGGFGTFPPRTRINYVQPEEYWTTAFTWLATQDQDIEKAVDRPAFISWWDYGFYEVAIGEHPTVADNFQDGIPPAANFHTATSEQQAISIWIIRLLEGEARKGDLSNTITETINRYLDENDTADFVLWIEEPTRSPSYGDPIAPEYGETLSEEYPVGQQWPENAVYHDGADLLTSRLTDEEITMLYREIQDITGNSIRYYGVEGYDRNIFNIFAFLADKSLLLVAGQGEYSPEDEFTQIKYVTQSGKELAFSEVLNRSDIQSQQDPITSTKTIYKDPYFNTMFYKTYIGFTQTGQGGQKSIPQYQLPCQNLRHFYAQFISPYPEQAYRQGQSAVVIAKYYEGANINGTITFLDEIKDFQVIVQQNITHYGTEIPIGHDTNISVNGTYQVIAPAGDVTLQVRRYPELGQNAVVLTNVTLGKNNSMYPAITEEEATRKTDDYHRQVDIEIPTASLKGHVYDNLDDTDSIYNESDTPLEDATVSIIGYDAFNTNQGTPAFDPNSFNEIQTDTEGYFNFTSLLPGYYQITIRTADGFEIESNPSLIVKPGSNWHNVSKPDEGNVEGTTYFDENDNDKYDSGEELSDVSIDVVYTTTGTNNVVETITSDENGKYQTSSFLPGDYELNATKLPDYETVTTLSISENETVIQNISMQYSKIKVTGETIRSDTNQPLSNITITFAEDTDVVNNTANTSEVQSDSTGAYTANLMPGSYIVTVSQEVNETGTMVTYTFSDELTLSIGQLSKTYTIALTREE